ncbi:doxX-like family protein [Collimonas fungivorans]|uniref:DoxX-like family protein n=1 Tax=Collimonas fungivorans TaxID=158899 RepID=A0A127P5Z8_9BURK|nr:DoxX family protein [Collimonas fungivorans]AMO93118.1 doxX-like family protein [Collimonas fungivorans]
MSNALKTPSFTPALGRLLMSLIFILSGVGKLAAPAATIGYIASTGLPLATLGYAAAVIVELGGGLLLLAGYQTRLVAAVLAVFAVVTALIFHHALGDQNQMIHFMKNLAMAGGLLQVAAFGAGAFSLDGRSRKLGQQAA